MTENAQENNRLGDRRFEHSEKIGQSAADSAGNGLVAILECAERAPGLLDLPNCLIEEIAAWIAKGSPLGSVLRFTHVNRRIYVLLTSCEKLWSGRHFHFPFFRRDNNLTVKKRSQASLLLCLSFKGAEAKKALDRRLIQAAGWSRSSKAAKPACQTCGARGDLRVCSGCGGPCYCDRACQKKDWPQHKLNCLPKSDAATTLGNLWCTAFKNAIGDTSIPTSRFNKYDFESLEVCDSCRVPRHCFLLSRNQVGDKEEGWADDITLCAFCLSTASGKDAPSCSRCFGVLNESFASPCCEIGFSASPRKSICQECVAWQDELLMCDQCSKEVCMYCDLDICSMCGLAECPDCTSGMQFCDNEGTLCNDCFWEHVGECDDFDCREVYSEFYGEDYSFSDSVDSDV